MNLIVFPAAGEDAKEEFFYGFVFYASIAVLAGEAPFQPAESRRKAGLHPTPYGPCGFTPAVEFDPSDTTCILQGVSPILFHRYRSVQAAILMNRPTRIDHIFFYLLAMFTFTMGVGLAVFFRPSEMPDDASAADWQALERVGFPERPASLGEERGDDAQARIEYELQRLRDPRTGDIPPNMRARELEKAASIPRREAIASKQGVHVVANWAERGPVNVGGRTRALAIDLDFDGTTNRRVLAGGISGGMFLSEDEGATWQLTTSLSQLASVTCIAQDPIDRDVWYYGTGETFGNSPSNGGATFLGQGIFKSTDGGASWTQLPATTANNAINVFDSVFDRVWNIVVHPTNGNVYAAVFGVILVSSDDGDSWQLSLGSQDPPFGIATDVAVASDGTLYATISRNSQQVAQFGIFQSTDGGVNWTNITSPEMGADPWRQVLGPSPSNPDIVYALIQSNQQGATAADHQLFRFDASTGTWTNLSANIPNVTVPDSRGNPPLDGNASFSSQGGYDLIVRVKPDDPDVVFIGGTNLYRSTDGGESFELVGGYANPYTFGLYPEHHPDQHAMSFYPDNPSSMISGHDGGVSKATDVLMSPQEWEPLNNGYVTSQFYAVAIDPEAGSDFVIGGLQDNGTWSTSSTNPGLPWNRQFSGDGGFAAVAPGGLPFYVSAQQGFIVRASVSDNQLVGSVVSPAGGQDFLFIAPYLLDPNDPRIMYLAESNQVWRNSNLDGIPPGNGNPTQVNWTPLTGSVVPGTRFVTTLAVSTTPADRLFFGATDFQFRTRIVRVDDPAANGPGTDVTPPGITQGSFPSSIGIHPNDGDELMVTFSNYNIPSIWHSTDGGATWVNIDGNLGGEDGPSVAWSLVMPTASGTLYFLATSTGVYSTDALDGSSTVWTQEGADVIGNVDTDMLVGRPEDGVLVAATHGRGVFSAVLDGTAGNAVLAASQTRIDLTAAPGDVATGTLELQNTGNVELEYTISQSDPGMQNALARTDALTVPLRAAHAPVATRKPINTARSPAGKAAFAPSEHRAGRVPFRKAGDDVLIYDDGNDQPDGFLGFADDTNRFFWGNEFLADGFDFQLETIQFFMRTESQLSNPIWVAVYDNDDMLVANGNLSLDPSPPGGQWYEVSLSTPLTFSNGEIFFVEVGASEMIDFPAGVDQTARVSDRSFFLDVQNDTYLNLNTQVDSGFEQGAFLVRAMGTIGEEENLPPEVDATVTTFNAAVGENITFDASASSDPDGAIVAYNWDFGDGATSNNAVAVHAYGAPGTYSVVVTVTDDDGASAQASGDIMVTSTSNQAPVSVITTSKTEADVNELITFDASQSSDADGEIVSYLWTFGDGDESPDEVATHAYSSPGTYDVSLTVTDENGAQGQSVIEVVVTSSAARLVVTPRVGSIPAGESASLGLSFRTDGLPEGLYEGEVGVWSAGGNVVIPVFVTISGAVDVEEETLVLDTYHLAQNYPNPFNRATSIRYQLPQQARVALDVFDVNGRRIRELDDGDKLRGIHEVQWDGKDQHGHDASSGLYFYRLTVYEENGRIAHYTGRMALVR